MKKISGHNSKFSGSSGFTLVELLVAVAIFTIVAMVSISALISVNDANKKAQTIRAIIDNLNFAVENMARNLRVGTEYNCSGAGNCSGGGNSITFKSSTGEPTAFYLQSINGNNQIIKVVGVGGDPLPITPYSEGSFQPLSIDYLNFYVAGVNPESGQPRVVIVVGGTARYSEKIESRFQIQTSVSQRLLEL